MVANLGIKIPETFVPKAAAAQTKKRSFENRGFFDLPPLFSCAESRREKFQLMGSEMAMEGVGSIALLPCGSISGHFIQLPHSICYGLHGTELECERECSRGEDYRLIKLTITNYNNKREQTVVVERRGHDAARFRTIDHAHGWEEDVVSMVKEKHGKKEIAISFECQTLKSEQAAEDHIRQFIPKLAGQDAVVNIGPMSIRGLDFEAEEQPEE